MRIRVLGPLEVLSGEGPVSLPGPRESALLALLAARYPDAVESAQLIDDLWGADPPGGAEKTLRAYVSTLRRALRADGLGEVVVTRRGGYALSPAAGETLDASLFEALISHAERLRDDGDLDGSVRTLQGALGLWRGPAFVEVATAPSAAPYARYLDEARMATLEQLVEVRLARGEHAELCSELAALCLAHPLRERLWGARMLALYRSGQQAEALAEYRRARARFRQELGIEPGKELRALEVAILRQDPGLEPPATRVQTRREPGPPLPLVLRAPAVGGFVGRSDELNALEVAWSLALAGTGQLALISGEPGIGKSALAGAFAERRRRAGAIVLAGRCDPAIGMPYQPLRDAIAPLLQSNAIVADELAPLFPGLLDPARQVRLTDPVTARLQLFDAICGRLARAASEAPMAIVLEDLHWADPSSLLLLRHLARRARACPMLIIGTLRDTEVQPEDPLAQLLTELQQDPGFTAIRLGGLGESEVVSLVASCAAASLHDLAGLGATLHRATEGNPLFVAQMLAHLSLAPEAFISETGALRLDPPLPSGVRDAIARRLARLSPEAVDVLTLASAIGAEFDLDLLQAACGGADPLEALELAERAGLIAELPGGGERFRFVHELIRQSLYGELTGPRRARIHQHVGEALEALAGEDPTSLAALAGHFAAAARRGYTEPAARYALRAGRQSLDQLAFAEAAATAERGVRCVALERRPDLESRCELELLLAEARLLARDIVACKQAAARAGEDARALRSAARLARAAIVGSYLNTFGQPSPDTPRLCEDALAAVGDSDPVATAQILAGLADYVASSESDAPRAEQLSARALGIARGCGDAAAHARTLFIHGDVLGWSPRVRERRELAEELIELAGRHGDQRAEANGHHMRALARLESGDLAGFDADRERIEALRGRIDYWYTDMYALLWRGMRALLDARLDEVESHAGELLGHARHDANVVNLYVGQLILLRREQGRLAELRPLVLDAIKHNPQVAGFRCAMAMIHAELGELTLAGKQLEHLGGDGFASLPRDATWTTSLTLLADVAAAVGHRAHAGTLRELLSPYAGLVIVATKGMACMGAADRYLGRLAATLGDRREAEAYFEAASALEERLGSPALLAHGRAYRRDTPVPAAVPGASGH